MPKQFGQLCVMPKHSFCVTSIYAAWHIGIALSSHFVVSVSSSSIFVIGVVCHCHTLYSRQYLKNGLSDLIQIWHVVVPQGVLYSLVTLNYH